MILNALKSYERLMTDG